MLGSLGAIVAAGVGMLTGWTLADPIIGAGIGLFIVPRTWRFLKQAIHILMEGTPPEIDIALLERKLLAIFGVHELPSSRRQYVSQGRLTPLSAQEALKTNFGLTHTTIQIFLDQQLREAEGEFRL